MPVSRHCFSGDLIDHDTEIVSFYLTSNPVVYEFRKQKMEWVLRAEVYCRRRSNTGRHVRRTVGQVFEIADEP